MRQIFSHKSDQFFDDLNIILFRDFAQLLSVCETPLYSNESLKSKDLLAGRNAYYSFNKTVVLNQVMRQQGEDSESVNFRALLSELKEGSVSYSSWQLMLTRLKLTLTLSEKQQFSTAVRIFPTKAAVQQHNLYRLKTDNQPVLYLKAKHNCSTAVKVSAEDADNLSAELYLSKESRIMLTHNLSVEFSLVNGTTSVLHDIV